jgi:dipeptidyl aminopeptidase/acylaminoacyl peptidase
MTLFPRLLPWMLALALAFPAPRASAEPFTVDHMLGSESFGAVRLSPDERHVLFERRGPYEDADRFDLGFLGTWSTSEVWIAERDAPGDARPLLPGPDGRGVILGEVSPSGRRVVVHRLDGQRWETGVAEAASGEVRWLGVGADPPVRGDTVLWRAEEELILLVRADGDLPYEIGALARAMRETGRRRRTTAAGGAAATVWSAGPLTPARSSAADMLTLRIDLRTGARTLVAEAPTQDLALSPDRRWLARLDRGPPYRVDPGTPLRALDPAEQGRLTLHDLVTGAVWSPCGGCDVAAGLLAWSDDGRLLVWARDPARDPAAGRLLTLTPAGRAVETAPLGDLRPDVGATRDAAFQTVRAGWMGDSPVVLARDAAGGRADWRRLTPEGPVDLTGRLPAAPGGLEALWSDGLLVVAEGAVWAVDPGGGARRLEAPAPVSSVAGLSPWVSLRRRLNTPPRRRWTAVRAADGALWRLGVDAPARRIAAAAAEPLAVGETLAVDRVVDDGVETLRLLTPTDPPRPLATLNAAHAAVEFARPLPVSAPGAPPGVGGSWLYAPPGGLKPGTPVIVVAYPGGSTRPPDNPAAFSAMANVQLLAGLGYAVLTPALPPTGPDGPSAGLADRVLAVLDAALAEYPDLDGDRVGYLGHSFGGYAGLVLATETDRIDSFVLLSASPDLAGSWGAFSGFGRANPEFGTSSRRGAGWAETGQGAMGGPPWKIPEVYVRHSPLYRADAIEAPILLLHGELDFVPVAGAEALFTALWRQDKAAELVVYWGEHHLFVSPGTIRDAWNRIDAWFARTLGVSPARLTPAPAAPPSAAPTPPPTRPPESPPPHPASGARPRPAAPP